MSTAYTVPTREQHAAGYRGSQPEPGIPCDCAGARAYCGEHADLAFFITTARPGAVSFVAGPYRTHAEALAAFRSVQEYAERVDPRAVWYSFGTARARKDQRTVLGVLYGKDGNNGSED